MHAEKNQELLSKIHETKLRARKIGSEAAAVMTDIDLRAIEKLVLEDRSLDLAVRYHDKICEALDALGVGKGGGDEKAGVEEGESEVEEREILLQKKQARSAALQNYQDVEFQVRKALTQIVGPLH